MPTLQTAPRRPRDAIALLRSDHKAVSELFDEFEHTNSAAKKKAIVANICHDLEVHTRLEEEIFYPAVQAALKDHELVPEATVEHASVKDLIAQVRDAEPDGDMFDARVKVMGEFVKHHVKEEHTAMFPKARKANIDLVELRDRMLARKEAIELEHASEGRP